MKLDNHFETIAVRRQSERSQHREHSVPLYLTSSFVFNDAEHARALFADEVDGAIYSRFSNPNTDEFIQKMSDLEGAEDGLATASGMSAVFTTLAGLLQQGDHVISSRAVFGSTHQILSKILSKFGIRFSYFSSHDIENLEQLICPETKCIFIETPSNPGLEIFDLKRIGKICRQHNIVFIVDNCFATPYLQEPIKFGADIVIHSATKYLDGQGRAVGGVILGRQDLIDSLRFFARHSGPSLSPFHAWLFSKSLETLAIRMERHCDNALKLASFLEKSPHVKTVRYPFLESHPQSALAKSQMKRGGGIVTFELTKGYAQATRFLNNLKLLSHSANLGDTRSIITHPASTTHSKLNSEEKKAVGISDGMIRISVGLEHINDIIADINQALLESVHISEKELS